jgi:hypothetical protein
LRAVLEELAGLSARKIAAALNERKIVTPTGGVWHAATVIRVQKRLGCLPPVGTVLSGKSIAL